MHWADRGPSFSNGPTPYEWRNGYDMPPPVTIWDFLEGEKPR